MKGYHGKIMFVIKQSKDLNPKQNLFTHKKRCGHVTNSTQSKLIKLDHVWKLTHRLSGRLCPSYELHFSVQLTRLGQTGYLAPKIKVNTR